MTLPSRSNASTVADRLAEIVGDRHVLSRPSELLVYNSDGLPGYRRQPRLAVFPATRDEAIAVVRLLAEKKITVAVLDVIPMTYEARTLYPETSYMMTLADYYIQRPTSTISSAISLQPPPSRLLLAKSAAPSVYRRS